MAKKVAMLCVMVIVLFFSVTYVASGSLIHVNESLLCIETDCARLINLPSDPSGFSRPFNMVVDPCDVDFNGNGVVDVQDIMKVANCWRSTDQACAQYNLDGDGDIDIVDIMLVAVHWGETCDKQ